MDTPVKHIHQDLIEGCRTKDPRAQFEIYRLYYKNMYNTSLRIVNNTAEAEDVMQDSFLDAFQRIEDFKGTASFGAWLKKIVINNSLDALKKNTGLSFVEEYDHEIPDHDDNDYAEDVDYQVEEIRKAITRLPDDYRVVLSLFLLEGYDHEEISDILNISNNTSRIRYFRAKQRLLEILQQERIRNLIF
ncbi:MAG: sigma-70 family RNA polymerase sigma factor [Bacteroidetes bacterium]|nr:sigma-70 family RNA polymerase sigma factor [Bacteroidota bacterium]